MDIRWKQRFSNYQKALKQLERALKIANPDMLHKQGIIQCFEYTFELAWKTLQDYLFEVKAYSEIKGPKPVLEQAFKDNLISDGLVWMDMLKSRNLTTHLYDEVQMEAIYTKVINDYYRPFKALNDLLRD